MNAMRGALVVGALRAISMPMLLAAAAVVFLVASIVEWSSLMRSADRQEAAILHQRLRVAADTALIQCASSSAESREIQVDGLTLRLGRSVGRDGVDHYVIDSIGGDAGEDVASDRFVARSLTGAPVPAFGHHRAATDVRALDQIGGSGGLLAASDWPRLDTQQVAAAGRAGRAAGFVRDRAIALRLLAAGTDRPDFVWRAEGRSHAPTIAGSLLVVPGNLWIPPGEAAFELHLERDLAVLVEGNLYLLRSVRTSGVGRLLLATVAGDDAVVFADLDGGGGWSHGDSLRVGDEFAGPIEGSGSVYVGLPGAGPLPAVCTDCALLAAGELHLAAPLCASGPLLVRHGVTSLPVGSDVIARDLLPAPEVSWTYTVGRDWLPGFEVFGPPRPGRLEFRMR